MVVKRLRKKNAAHSCWKSRAELCASKALRPLRWVSSSRARQRHQTHSYDHFGDRGRAADGALSGLRDRQLSQEISRDVEQRQ